MPRIARAESLTGYYHVTQRGLGKQLLFEYPQDYKKCIEKLKEVKEELEIELAGYCLMNNHIHLLIKAPNIAMLSAYMQRIETSYANYFNKKYERSGYVFQNRFHSDPINDELYLLCCLKYIHNNPLKAGISARESYPWSSYQSYITGEGFVDTKEILEIILRESSFIEFSKSNDKKYIKKIYDVESDDSFIQIGIDLISEILGVKCNNGFLVNQLNKPLRNKIVFSLIDAGFTNKEIELLTGVSQGVIKYVKKTSRQKVVNDGLNTCPQKAKMTG